MLRTRLATAAVAIPALWLFIVYASPERFSGCWSPPASPHAIRTCGVQA